MFKLLTISSLNYFSPGGESLKHPSILYQFDFGSLTNSSLRQIERELIEVGVFLLHVDIWPMLMQLLLLKPDLMDKHFTLQATTSVYDALAELPLTSLSYASVLKPLIDLDFVSQTKNSWMDVSDLNKSLISSFLKCSSVPFQCCLGCRTQRDCQWHQEELGRGEHWQIDMKWW